MEHQIRVYLTWTLLLLLTNSTASPIFPIQPQTIEVGYSSDKINKSPNDLGEQSRQNFSSSHLDGTLYQDSSLIDPKIQEIPTSTESKVGDVTWSVIDDLDTGESNQTAVLTANQKFGYILQKPDFKRFRYEEKTEDGFINGEFGIHHNNGLIRGVQYTADIGVNPKFLYLALLKFMSM